MEPWNRTDRKICLWGAGLQGKKVQCYLQTKCEVDCYYDFDEALWGTTMNGIPVKQWIADESSFVIIATPNWKEVSKYLAKNGLKPFKDFVPWLFIMGEAVDYELIYELQQSSGKLDEESWRYYKDICGKLVIFHGYCHVGSVLANMVSLYPDFKREYQIVVAPRIFEICHTFEGGKAAVAQSYANDVMFLGQADIFVYQDNPEMNEYTSQMEMAAFLEKLNEQCIKIKIARINFSGYFPQANKRLRSLTEEEWTYPLFAYYDHYVINLCKKGLEEDKILKTISSEDFIAPERVEMSMYYALMYLKKEEEDADIKVYDFIESNCKEQQLFAAPGHPHNCLMIELANRILRYIYPEKEIELQNIFGEDDIALKCSTLQGQDVPIYPAVLKALNLKNYKKRYFVNRFSGFCEMLSFEEYMKEYIKYVKMNL